MPNAMQELPKQGVRICEGARIHLAGKDQKAFLEEVIFDVLLKGSLELPSRHRALGCWAEEDPTAKKQ